MVDPSGLLVVGVFVAAFVGYNIGGSSTGVAFGPAVGSRVTGKAVAAALFTAFALWGGWTVGRNVITTMSQGIVPESQGVLLAIGAIGVGAFTIARRTLDTVGEDLTDLPVLASIIVSLVGATIITILSGLGIPASLAVTMTSCIIGLGWGRSSRAVTVVEAVETTT